MNFGYLRYSQEKGHFVYKCKRCNGIDNSIEMFLDPFGEPAAYVLNKTLWHKCKDGKGMGVLELMGAEFDQEKTGSNVEENK